MKALASKTSKFVVGYDVMYLHKVQVGVEATNEAGAIRKVRAAFDRGDLWDNAPSMPLLLDDFEEFDDGTCLTFEAEELGDGVAFPERSASVTYLLQKEAAFKVCVALLKWTMERGEGDAKAPGLAEAIAKAKEAMPHLAKEVAQSNTGG